MLDGVPEHRKGAPTPTEPTGHSEAAERAWSAPVSAHAGLRLRDAIEAREKTADDRWELELEWEPDDPDPAPTARHRRAF